MSGKFPNLLKTINPQIQAAHEPPPKKNRSTKRKHTVHNQNAGN